MARLSCFSALTSIQCSIACCSEVALEPHHNPDIASYLRIQHALFIHLSASLLVRCCGRANRRTSIDRQRPLHGKDGHAGVCVSKSSCDGAGESSINNACPGTPEDIKCCTKPSCQQAGRSGDCRWEEKCGIGSETLTGLCPGLNAFKCCVPKDDKPDSGGDLGKKILKQAKEAEGTSCKS